MPLEYPIHERTLDNGLRVVVSPDSSVPMVTVNLWVDVGSRHEVPGRTGLAHLPDGNLRIMESSCSP